MVKKVGKCLAIIGLVIILGVSFVSLVAPRFFSVDNLPFWSHQTEKVLAMVIMGAFFVCLGGMFLVIFSEIMGISIED